MGDLISLLSGIVQFPDAGTGWFPFIGKFVYILIDAMYGSGALSYGFAIIFFTLILKLILLPLDFGNRYFTKKNARQMERIKPEEDALKEQFANDPMAFNRAKQELYKKKGYKMGGFCTFNIINLALTLIIFISVFGALRGVADYNVNLQYKNSLQPVYQEYEAMNLNEIDPVKYPITGVYNLFETDAEGNLVDDDENIIAQLTLDTAFGEGTYVELMTDFSTKVNAAYEDSRVGFLWVSNIWRPDTWASKTYGWSEFQTAAKSVQDSVFSTDNIPGYADMSPGEKLDAENAYKAALELQYKIILAQIEPNQGGWNGWLLLIIFAAGATYLSAFLNARLMNNKKTEKDKPKETTPQYSMRNVKNQADKTAMPAVNPQAMNKIMKFVLPVIMVIFTMSSTAALAIYIISSSVFSTLITLGLKWPVDKLLDWQEKRAITRGDAPEEVDPNVINPHAKYFKNKRSKQK